MTPVQLETELQFTTARSGGAGGQHVNKVETKVTAIWLPDQSLLLSEEQKKIVKEKLANRLNKKGALLLSSEVHRSQAANRGEVIKKINALVTNALTPKKPRIATAPTNASKNRRVEQKKKSAIIKASRKKISRNYFDE
ncbi:MAG: aminoacyl-tRNA hydrolase [Bacteroidetes bacterium]|nr:aminoacyl-tRNA hydrolase [Bacteroidota bacterium]